MKPFLTIFTPTYNRAHTLGRVYESLCNQTCQYFEWLLIDDGSTDETSLKAEEWMNKAPFPMKYVYKENGGLHTGYNMAYRMANGELTMCVDSDDFLPIDAVEILHSQWNEEDAKKYSGIIGLDYYANTNFPVGGCFPDNLHHCYLSELFTKNIHKRDVKQAMRTDLMKEAAPMIGFPGEKYFNPVYLLLKVGDKMPLKLINKNLCYVDYQKDDSMSADIIGQYFQSPNSFVKLRLLQLSLLHTSLKYKFITTIHFIAESIISGDVSNFRKHPNKFSVIMLFPIGLILWIYLKYAHSTGNHFIAKWWS